LWRKKRIPAVLLLKSLGDRIKAMMESDRNSGVQQMERGRRVMAVLQTQSGFAARCEVAEAGESPI
jgi:hypothetical protein